MIQKYFPIPLFIFNFIIGCSSSTETTSDVKSVRTINVSDEIARNITVIIPNGWREIKDNADQLFEIWLVNKENNAVICFIPVNFSEGLEIPTNDKRLEIIENILITRRKGTGNDFQIIEQRMLDDKYLIKSTKFSINKHLQNSMVFGNGTYYYESLAYYGKNLEPTNSEITNLIELQEEVILGIEFK